MPAERATALVLRTTDWSETSRIATLWTREFGKVRVLAKGGRRLNSNLFDATLAALRDLGDAGAQTGPRLAAYELTWLHELGYSPALDACAACGISGGVPNGSGSRRPVFSAAAGGVVCPACATHQQQGTQRSWVARPIKAETLAALRTLRQDGEAWRRPWGAAVRAELRQVLGQYVSYRIGRRLRTLPYLTA